MSSRKEPKHTPDETNMVMKSETTATLCGDIVVWCVFFFFLWQNSKVRKGCFWGLCCDKWQRKSYIYIFMGKLELVLWREKDWALIVRKKKNLLRVRRNEYWGVTRILNQWLFVEEKYEIWVRYFQVLLCLFTNCQTFCAKCVSIDC